MSSLDDLIMHDSFYWDLFKGLDVGEISWLLSDDPLNSVFIYDHAGKSVERADFGLPWPVLFLLGFRHKKHRFCGNKIPDIRDFVQCTAEAIDKIKWRAFFKDTAPRPCHRQLLYPRRVAPFSAQSSCQRFLSSAKLLHIGLIWGQCFSRQMSSHQEF